MADYQLHRLIHRVGKGIQHLEVHDKALLPLRLSAAVVPEHLDFRSRGLKPD